MNKRVAGFVLLSVAIVATILAFTTATSYVPQRPLTHNLQNAYLFRSTYRLPAQEGEYLGELVVEREGVTLGMVVAGTTAVGLLGVGLLIFGGGRSDA